MTHKIIWSPQHEARLVDLVKEADHVWNNKNTDFFNARLRNSSFQDIAAKLGGDFTTKSVQERWTSIKSTYRNNLRKVEVTKKTAQTPEDIYQPTWHLWEQCQFMAGLEFKAIKRKLERTQALPIEHVKQEFDNNDSDFEPLSNKKASTSSSGTKRRVMKRIDKSECERLLEEARSVLKVLENDERLNPPTEGSKFTHISKHVAERLSKMRPYDAECASKRIMDILSLFSEFNPDNPNRSEY